SIAVHDEIDTFSGAAHEDALAHVARVDEALHFLTRAFVCSGCFLAQVMNAAMNIGVLLFEIDATAIDDDLWHLRRSGVVEINQRLAVYGLLQHGKVSANALNVPSRRNR